MDRFQFTNGCIVRVFILIPAYREAQVIGDVIRNLHPLKHTVVVINDGSPDNTADVARAAGAIVLTHCMNLGQGAALQTGLEYARRQRADRVVTFDADGQHSPDDVTALLHAMDEKDVDIALGSRFLGKAPGIGWLRKLILKLAVIYTNLSTGLRLTDTHNGLRALGATAIDCIQLKQNRMAHASELLQQVAEHRLRYTEVPCTITYTPYSVAKGQKLFNAVNILTDQTIGKLHK